MDRSLKYRRHLESLRKALTSRVALMRRLAGRGWGAGATTLRTATLALALVHSTTEYCVPVWCRSAHTRHIDPTINDACELWLDACVLHQRTACQSSQASNLLSFVAKETHCLYQALPWRLDICSTADLSTEFERTASQIDIPICTRCTRTYLFI